MSEELAPLLAAEGQRVALAVESASTLAVIRRSDHVRVGSVVLSGSRDCTVIESLCIDVEARSYGAGSEAAWLLVEAARAAGSGQLRAWAHPNLGLSVYFWTRMGFSPQHGEGPEGGIWFKRGMYDVRLPRRRVARGRVAELPTHWSGG